MAKRMSNFSKSKILSDEEPLDLVIIITKQDATIPFVTMVVAKPVLPLAAKCTRFCNASV